MSTEYLHGIHYKNGLVTKGQIDYLVQEEEEAHRKGYTLKSKSDLTVWLYILEDTKNTGVFKIGISNHTYSRISQINRTDKISIFNHRFRLVEHFFVGDRDIAEVYEHSLLSQYKKIVQESCIFWSYRTDICGKGAFDS